MFKFMVKRTRSPKIRVENIDSIMTLQRHVTLTLWRPSSPNVTSIKYSIPSRILFLPIKMVQRWLYDVELDWLIDWLFTVLLQNISLIWRPHHCRWRSAKFRPMLGAQGLWAGGIFIMPHLLWHRASVFQVSSEGSPHSVASYDTRGDVDDLF
jgi:hypothetical protein